MKLNPQGIFNPSINEYSVDTIWQNLMPMKFYFVKKQLQLNFNPKKICASTVNEKKKQLK